MRYFTHPDVLDRGIREGWAEAETDPTRIDWPERQGRALVPFEVVDGRPVRPGPLMGLRGRGELGHWGEQACADAVVTADTPDGQWLVMVDRRDGHGWAVPGGYVDPGETPGQAAFRELEEETGLIPQVTDEAIQVLEAAVVDDPRGTDESWMTTVAVRIHLGVFERQQDLPLLRPGSDAKRAAWVKADSYPNLVAFLATTYQGQVFAAHKVMLSDLL